MNQGPSPEQTPARRVQTRDPEQTAVRNLLLRALAPEDFALLRPHLEGVLLKRTQVLVERNTPLHFVHFPDTALASILATTPEGRRQEVGLYGRDGMGSTAVVLGVDRTPHETVIQVEGTGWRMPAEALREELARSPTLLGLLLRYVQTFTLQAAQTALTNSNHAMEERLARWLLLCHDRLDGDELPLTHGFLSLMLAASRPTVTLTTHVLEGAGMIRTRRGAITVLDRGKLEDAAGESYGPAEAEYERLIGVRLR